MSSEMLAQDLLLSRSIHMSFDYIATAENPR
jgi:hypothetical protein